jgi:spermidine/putrescine transport system permease protein
MERQTRRLRRIADVGLDHPVMSSPALLFVLVAFALPMAVMVLYTFWPTRGGDVVHDFTLGNYSRLFEEPLYVRTLLRTFWVVGLSSLLTVAATFPFAYFVATKVRPSRRIAWILLAVLPFFTSYLIRVFSWLNIFGTNGAANEAIRALGLSDTPVGFFQQGTSAIVITFVYLLFPLAFLTSYVTLERTDPGLREAASDLGAKPWQVLAKVTVPLAGSGLLAGFAFSFIAMAGDYVTPRLIGGTKGSLFSNLIVNQFGLSVQWGFGSTLALVLLVSVLVFLVLLRVTVGTRAAGDFTRRYEPQRAPFLAAYSTLFVLFLYLPIVLLVLFAFNTSSFVGFPVTGLTTEWFSEVLSDPDVIAAFWTSIEVAAYAVTIAIVVGTPAAVQLARTRGRGRDVRLTTLTLPLLVPPVVLGLGIIIGLNAVGVSRGFWLIVAGHVLLILPVVVLVVLARLEGMDQNQELAAMDLGAPPWRALLSVTVPQSLPAILAAAMLGFALSMDEFILTFLVTSTTTTLPLYVYSSLRFEIDPSLNAISTLVLSASLVISLLAALAFAGTRTIRRRRLA